MTIPLGYRNAGLKLGSAIPIMAYMSLPMCRFARGSSEYNLRGDPEHLGS